MKHSTVYEQLTDPTLPMDKSFRHISYALFRTDEDFGRVIATRFPAGSVLAVGDILQSRLCLSNEALQYLIRLRDSEKPLFCLSCAGLGLLCKSYDASAGMGLYLHIHTRPASGARLLTSGALGTPDGHAFGITRRIREQNVPLTVEDSTSFSALIDAWRAVQSVSDGLSALRMRNIIGSFHEPPAPTLGALADAAERMAAFAGCALTCTVTDRYSRVVCHRPRLLEALLLYLLTEVRTHAAKRRAIITVSTRPEPRGRGENHLCLSLAYAVDTLHMAGKTRAHISQTRQYLTNVADASGLDLHFPPLLPPNLRMPDVRKDYLSHQTVTLEWLADPTLLPTSDLKHPTGLDRPEDTGF